jgi:hypothetical protein
MQGSVRLRTHHIRTEPTVGELAGVLRCSKLGGRDAPKNGKPAPIRLPSLIKIDRIQTRPPASWTFALKSLSRISLTDCIESKNDEE